MAAADPDDLLATGSAALAAGQWAGARAAFEDALAREPTAEAHAGLADVLWWVGETQASVQHHERAYAAFRHRDDLPNAAMGAVGLYLTYRASLGRTAVARGWLARAARMVEEAGLAPLAGWGRRLLRAAPADLADLRADERWAMVVDLGVRAVLLQPDVRGIPRRIGSWSGVARRTTCLVECRS